MIRLGYVDNQPVAIPTILDQAFIMDVSCSVDEGQQQLTPRQACVGPIQSTHLLYSASSINFVSFLDLYSQLMFGLSDPATVSRVIPTSMHVLQILYILCKILLVKRLL
jgi:hypothetical protein